MEHNYYEGESFIPVFVIPAIIRLDTHKLNKLHNTSKNTLYTVLFLRRQSFTDMTFLIALVYQGLKYYVDIYWQGVLHKTPFG